MDHAALAVVGSADTSGMPLTEDDVDRAVNRRLIDLLPSILLALDTPTTFDEVAVAAQALATSEFAIDVNSAKRIIGNMHQPDTSAPPATDTASLDWFTYTDVANWYYRAFTSTALQNTPDANGKLHFADRRERAVAGTREDWGSADFTRTDAYFDGTAWSVCPTSFENTATPRDAQGRSESLYCNAYQSTSVRAARDISGLRMADIVAEIRAYPLFSTQGTYSSWGPDPAQTGNALFPAGSALYYQTTTQRVTPDAYNPLAGGGVRLYTPEIVAGNASACATVTSTNFDSLRHDAPSLEEMLKGFIGQPCVFTADSTTGPRNEWWGNSTISIGTVTGPANPNAYYQSSRSVRAAFTGGNTVRYYNCELRASDGSPRNCDPIGEPGSYTTQAVGDARVLRFNNLPPVPAATLTYNRIFVERGANVYFGYRDKPRTNNSVRPNLEAANALFAQLGV